MANPNEMYQLTINQATKYDLQATDLQGLDLIQESATRFHAITNQHSFYIDVLATDFKQKIVTLKINGKTHTISIADENDLLIKKLGLLAVNTQKINQINSPMPGLVLDIAVEEGQQVQKGDSILILEAMKMENIIKAPNDATIKAIRITKGKAVEKGELLIELE